MFHALSCRMFVLTLCLSIFFACTLVSPWSDKCSDFFTGKETELQPFFNRTLCEGDGRLCKEGFKAALEKVRNHSLRASCRDDGSDDASKKYCWVRRVKYYFNFFRMSHSEDRILYELKLTALGRKCESQDYD